MEDTLVFISKSKLRSKQACGFKTTVDGKLYRGILVKRDDRYYAYQNMCKHLPITLDLNDDNFFSHDEKYLQCQMHGAMYEVETGLCIGGPCEGASLNSLKIIEEPDQLIIHIPPRKAKPKID